MVNRMPNPFPLPNAQRWGEDAYGLFQDIDIAGIPQRMRWIPAGEYFMGSPKDEEGRFDSHENLQHVVIETAFWLANTTVSQALWYAVMADKPSHFNGDDLPVEQVSWNDCQQLIHALSQHSPQLAWRLPSEPEWEYACRAGTRSAFNFEGKLDISQANYRGTWDYEEKFGKGALQQTAPVKDYTPNDWGLYQMHGNVWEWCSTPWRVKALAQQQDVAVDKAKDDEQDYVLRGGAWGDYGRLCRSAYRDHSRAGRRYNFIGLRLALGHELR